MVLVQEVDAGSCRQDLLGTVFETGPYHSWTVGCNKLHKNQNSSQIMWGVSVVSIVDANEKVS